jgi:hypothetical protein
MPKTAESAESRMIEAYEAAKRVKKPNISKIAREYGVPPRTLYNRVKKGMPARACSIPVNRALDRAQEEALVRWICQLNDWNMPPTPRLIEAWANRSLARASKPGRVSKMWVYRFIKRLPPDLQLGPVKQRTKESKRIQAEDAGLLAHWYDLLENLLKGVPPRLVYNFDECGFRPGEGKNQRVVGRKGTKRSGPDLAETERGENITALECIAADGWQMDPLFIFKSGGVFMEAWFDGSEDLPPNTMVGTSPNGWISDQLANQWLDYFIEATRDRTKRGEKRILIFDGHGAHLTLEFLQKCEDHNILPFGFIAHSTHLCQPLDGKPFLSYKQHFRSLNNDISYWAGEPMGKAEFLRAIGPVRSKAFNQRIIRESFKDRGIYPVDASKVLSKLSNGSWDNIPDLIAPDLCSYGSRTPSPPPANLSSSSVENTPPKSTKALQKNQTKLSKHADLLTPKLQRNLKRIFHHNRIAVDHLSMANDTIARIRAAQEPIQRSKTKRQIKGLSHTGILTTRDANRSITTRKAKEDTAEERRFAKDYEKRYGRKPHPFNSGASEAAIEAARVAQEDGDPFYLDPGPVG